MRILRIARFLVEWCAEKSHDNTPKIGLSVLSELLKQPDLGTQTLKTQHFQYNKLHFLSFA